MSIFNWIFYIPFTELNSAILACSSNSFLVSDRDGICENKTG